MRGFYGNVRARVRHDGAEEETVEGDGKGGRHEMASDGTRVSAEAEAEAGGRSWRKKPDKILTCSDGAWKLPCRCALVALFATKLQLLPSSGSKPSQSAKNECCRCLRSCRC